MQKSILVLLEEEAPFIALEAEVKHFKGCVPWISLASCNSATDYSWGCKDVCEFYYSRYVYIHIRALPQDKCATRPPSNC